MDSNIDIQTTCSFNTILAPYMLHFHYIYIKNMTKSNGQMDISHSLLSIQWKYRYIVKKHVSMGFRTEIRTRKSQFYILGIAIFNMPFLEPCTPMKFHYHLNPMLGDPTNRFIMVVALHKSWWTRSKYMHFIAYGPQSKGERTS